MQTPHSTPPKLRFSPTAWAKLLCLRDLGPTEVGGFGITDAGDLLNIRDIALVPQCCNEVFVAFDDTAVAEFFDDQIDQGRQPEQFGRIWIHTHPGESAQPSSVDVETFDRVFGRCDWAVMFILARGGQTFAELSWRHGGPASIPLDVEVDFTLPFEGSDAEAWEAEYLDCVEPESWQEPRSINDLAREINAHPQHFAEFDDPHLWPDLFDTFDSSRSSRVPGA
jgi:proteasome lid subunit RPN8/RPN11